MKGVSKMSFCVAAVCLCLVIHLQAQNEYNYDESRVGNYTLPPVLKLATGKWVSGPAEWKQRRAELLQLFADDVYGRMPSKPAGMHFELLKIDPHALSGNAISKQVRIYFTKGEKAPYMDVILYLPAKTSKPVPVFIGLNFKGNQSIHKDKAILCSEKHPELLKNTHKKQVQLIRGEQAERWEIDTLVKNGFGVASAYCGDLELDFPDGWKTGIRTTLQNELNIKPDEWGAISAWAWGLSRIMDYLETDKQVDPERVIVTGHSRLAKAALWAGATDTRFAAVIANNSGEGGAALSRRWFGETIGLINKRFPHWFVAKYKTYNNNVDALPVDQHMLLALIAPRPLYVASATEDLWSDPKGEFLSAKNAEPVYALFDKKGLGIDTMPKPDSSVGRTIRYHIRTGKHNILLFDWLQYIKFAKENVPERKR